MAARLHHRKTQKLPIVLLVFLLCVQNIGYASHGVMTETMTLSESETAEQLVTEHNTPACHGMPETTDITDSDATAISSNIDNTSAQMTCCDNEQCTDAHCMMPAGTYFVFTPLDYFIAHASDALMSQHHCTQSIKPSPPIRPPIA